MTAVTAEQLAEILRARADWLDQYASPSRLYIMREQFRAAAAKLEECAALVAEVERLTNDLRSVKPAMKAEARRHAKARQDTHAAQREAAQLRAALREFLVWFGRQNDGLEGVRYLNGDSDKYPGTGHDDIKKIGAIARAALPEEPRT